MLAAIIDIGSNSVRLVLYQYNGHHAQPIFNDKLACALGASLVYSSTLDEQAKERVRDMIIRFKHIINAHQPDYVTAIATAAMRESDDGAAFAEELSQSLGHPVRIIDGLREAVYSAIGVRSTSWQAQGIVADLGGGSLDIAQLLPNGEAHGVLSIANGTLGLSAIYKESGAKGVRRYINAELENGVAITADTLYAVGGSFRALAHHHIILSDHPLRLIHDYAMTRDTLRLLEQSMKRTLMSNEPFIGVPRKRQSHVYPALLALQQLMEYYQARKVVVSSVGVREGALRASRHDDAPYDPLLAMVQAMPEAQAQSSYAHALRDWLLEILPHVGQERRLIVAFAYISEMAIAVHPDHRAIFAYERMLSTMSYGLTHKQQVFLACALYYRYRSKEQESDEVRLLSPQEHDYAYLLGKCAAIAHTLSAGHPALLRQYYGVCEQGVMIIKSCGGEAMTVPPKVANLCEGLGEIISALSNLSL